MITKDKVTEIFCIIDEFDKKLSNELSKSLHMSKCQEISEQGLHGGVQGRERNDGLVSRIQAASDVQRFQEYYNILSYKSKRGQPGRKGLESLPQTPLWESVR